MTITSKAQNLLNTANENSENDFRANTIPLAGRVAAGKPIEAIEDIDRLSIDSSFGNISDLYALEVKGESMIGDGIFDGDYVICRKSATANTGQLVIAIVDDENATLKRFYKEKDCVRLEPSNDAFKPIYAKNCRIDGLVVGLIRKF